MASRHLRVASDGFADAYAGVDEGAYDPDGFYVTSVNKHDHRAETRLALKPETKNAIDALVASGDLKGTPITTYGAFMRDAAVHNLHRLSRLIHTPEIARLAEQQRHLALIEQMADEADSMRKLVADADDRLNASTKAQDVYLTERLVEMYEAVLVTMREPYAADLEETMKDARRWLRARAAVTTN